MKIIKENFKSIHELLQIVDSRPNNAEMSGKFSSKEGDKEFTETRSWNHAVDLFEHGYTDVLDEIKRGIAKNVKASSPQERRQIRTGVVGYTPHVPNAIQGLPNSMIYTEKQIQKVKTVSILYSPCENCGLEAKTFIKSGICVLSAINILELSGVRVNLEVAFFQGESGNGNEGTKASVKVKDYREHMDIQKLCFPVVHPSMFRRFGFRWLETNPEIGRDGWSWGYGRHSKNVRKQIVSEMNQNQFYCDLSDTEKVGYDPKKLVETWK